MGAFSRNKGARAERDAGCRLSCTTGKQQYASPQAAHKALQATLRTHHRKPKAWNKGKPGVYQCAFCHQWHTTNTFRREAA